MDLNKVLSTGSDFHTTGAGNIHHELALLTLPSTKYHFLHAHLDVISRVLSKNALQIRRENIGFRKEREMVKEIKDEIQKKGKSLSITEVRHVKEIAKHYGTAAVHQQEAAETSETKSDAPKSESASIEENLEAKMAARQAVKAGVRPNQPTARIDRALANQAPVTSQASSEAHSFSPYDHRSHQEEVKRVVAIGQVRRPGVAAPDDPRSQRDSHGTGLVAKDSHGMGLSANRRLGLGLKDQAGSKNNNLPSTPPPRISLAA